MQLSILVISRTPALLNAMLASLRDASSLPHKEVEVLCSWNGSQDDERAIYNESGYDLFIAQRTPYHFATNMNGLADKATGTDLLLINDDVVLDPGSVDAALRSLQANPDAGLVGARLRHSNGLLAHAGMGFDSRNNAYHMLENLLPADCDWAIEADRPVPAVTGAVMLLARNTFQELRFQEQYRQCGEDVELCLDLRQHLNKQVWLCVGASGIHESETTRQHQESSEQLSEDRVRMRARYHRFINEVSSDQLQLELRCSQREVEILKEIGQSNALALLEKQESEARREFEEIEEISNLKAQLNSEKQTTTSLQLYRLRLEQDLEQLQIEKRMHLSEVREIEALRQQLDSLSQGWIPPRLRR
jgi:GT2 family glycosyltransferase